MLHAENRALEITSKIVTARAENSAVPINGAAGKELGDYFEAIYSKVVEITKGIKD